MKKPTLRDAIDGSIPLTSSHIQALVYIFLRRCSSTNQAKARLRLAHPTNLPGLAIFEQIILVEDGIDFVVAQDWQAERKRIQRLLIGD